jgi:hypothetical protein
LVKLSEQLNKQMKNFVSILCAGLLLNSAYAAEKSAVTQTPPTVTLQDFKLTGDLSSDRANFTMTAVANVENPKGDSLELLSGSVALTEIGTHPKWQLRAEQGRYIAVFERAGKFPITLKFTAAVKQNANWNSVDFRVAPGAVLPISLQGLGADTQFDFVGAARPERKGNEFASYLPSDGTVKLSWKEARKAEEGKLFYSAEMLSQVSVSPGLMRQTALLDFKVMQGELNRVTLLLRGDGEVTRVSGDQVLAWNIEERRSPDRLESTNASNRADLEIGAPAERRLVVQLNQPQKDSFSLQVQLQTPLGAFPQTAEIVRLQPEGATRFAGYFRVVNEGAVRLEVAQASGLSQISPEQFPESDATRATLRASGSQRFAYRFSSADYALRVQADQIQPELSVSEVLAYHHGQNELAIEAEIELDVREAPLRELLIHVPKGYAIARINASGMSDYFLTEPGSAGILPASSESDAETRRQDAGAPRDLRIIYGQPVSGRQVIQLRLERNKPLDESNWTLPRIEVAKAKSVRGNIGISADAGFRLSVERSQALTEIATAFFPGKMANLQTAFRLSDPAWEATMRVERLPQTVQADALHLFSIGEGVAYGSSVINYQISGAPVSTFRVELSDEYFNVEFTGKDVRNWQKTTNGFVVQLHSPVSGAYTLLATYERPFKAAGETLTFTGAQPLGVQSEQGHTIVVSAYQFQVKPVDVSSGLLPLEPGEVPAEYRLFFDAPVLAAYRYTSRPFNLKLALSPLEQGKSLDQVVDRASLVTHISKEGQALTDVTYFVKNRGNPNFKLTLPVGVELWSATVNDASIVPVKDGDANLIPLPQRADPNSVLKLDLKLATKSLDAKRVMIGVPAVSAPVLLTEWKLEPDAGQRLVFVKGSLTPAGGFRDLSGFAQLARMSGVRLLTSAATMLFFIFAALVLWRWAGSEGVERFSGRHVGGFLLGVVALVLAAFALPGIFDLAEQCRAFTSNDISFLAPVQQAASALTMEVQNVSEKTSAFSLIRNAWPALFGLIIFVLGVLADEGWKKFLAKILGWLLFAWAALRLPNGVPWFLAVIVAFLVIHVLIPMLRRLWLLPRKPVPENGTAPASAAASLLVIGFILLSCGCKAVGASPATNPVARASVPESVVQQIRVEKKFVMVSAKIRWRAEKGNTLPILFEPAILTSAVYPPKSLKLETTRVGERRAQELTAKSDGVFDVELQYQLGVTEWPGESVFALPTPYGLINQVQLTIAGQDVDVYASQAVSVQREFSGSNTVATLVLSPVSDPKVGWKPRSRDAKREKAVFYAEMSQLYVPSAGVIEGAHLVNIRPAQGELSELVFDVPNGATVTDVASQRPEVRGQKADPLVSLWRFDPDARKLRVTLSRPQSKPFTLLVRSQIATGTLPFEQSVGLIFVDGAANQIGTLGIATGNEVQLDLVNPEKASAINLEDFPAEPPQILSAQVPSLTVRRAFRYSDTKAVASLKVSAVEPDVRVETQNTLSLGEDRTVLAANVAVDITRAGIFRLSFVMPLGFDVETISGATLSHWTESKSDTNRVVTLNLRGKTEGHQQFAINLSGPGVKTSRAWTVPQLTLREANKQQGTLLVVPEQGMQLQAATLDGLSQLDPQRSGIRQKGVLAFRVLQSPWTLALGIEQVEAWVQVTSLQHATVNEAQVKVAANLQYQIENTGLKSLRVSIPTNAESVHFTGELVSDFLRVPDAVTNGLQQWEIKLQRRVIGAYLLRVTYQTLIAENATETNLRGVQADNVNLQRGFVTLQSGGRLQVNADSASVALQPTEWQSIPRALKQNIEAESASYAFRLAEPTFELPLKLDRHEAVKLLPARVNNVAFTSVISDAGVMLTQARLEIFPGDKRLLAVRLPKDARYWFAFVNQNGVWPWRQGDQILIPMDQSSGAGFQPASGERQAGSPPHYKPVPVEVFFSSQVGAQDGRSLDLELLAPKFDLPLENISWRVYLGEKWQVKKWAGTMQLAEERIAPATTLDLASYLQTEALLQREKTRDAEEMLALGNSALEKGDPQQARRAFQAAYGLSVHDNAFNEDARVQLHNLKLQQALIGLNVRQAANAGEAATGMGGRLRELQGAKDLNYTQQDAKEIIDRNSADENSAYMKVAEKLIQQQDAAVASATAIRANIPEQGRVLTFQRAVAVDRDADLRINLQTAASKTAPWGIRTIILATTAAILVLFAWAAYRSPVVLRR